MKINFFSNGSCNNHGCEAIYRSLMKILSDNDFYAFTEYYNDDSEILKEGLKFIDIYKNSPKKIDEIIYKIRYTISSNDEIYFKYIYKPFYKTLNKYNEVFLSVGGDNYCYGYNDWLKVLNNYIRKKNNYIILTGCSIEPTSLDEKMLNILRSFKGIIARETITYNALVEKGINNVYLAPDPAFILDTKDIFTNIKFFKNKTIGLNISPLILNEKEELICENIEKLIQYVLNKTDYNILFIPHVMIDGNNDHELMLRFYHKLKDNSRVKIIKSNSAEELKGYIAKCYILITARTHASIAAYSNCIPTLVLGYSVKSKGIAKDIFGTYHQYVLPTKDILTNHDILDHFFYLENNYDQIKKHLEEFMPNYKNDCYRIKDIIEELCNE